MPKITSNQLRKQKQASENSGEKSGIARQLGPLLNKDLGQHLLKNPLIVNSIIDKVKSFGLYVLGLNIKKCAFL